jgi:hypothetical protein
MSPKIHCYEFNDFRSNYFHKKVTICKVGKSVMWSSKEQIKFGYKKIKQRNWKWEEN